jgi:hypothetical protein
MMAGLSCVQITGGSVTSNAMGTASPAEEHNEGWKTLSSDWVDLKHVKKALNPTCVQMVGIGDTAAHHKSGVKPPHSVQEEVLKSCKGNEH